jgi:PAS domain S-box-containing protein
MNDPLSPAINPTNSPSSELRYRRLFEAARDGILLVNPVTRQIVDANPFMEEFLGYTHAEFLGRELFEFGLLQDEAVSQAAFRELQKNGYIRYENLPLQTKDGRTVAVEFVSNLYEEGDQQIIQCNVRDIAVRQQHEQALRDGEQSLARHAAALEALVAHRTAELSRSNAQLQTFVYSIAHDLRAPLRSMQGFSQLLLQDQAANLTQQGRDYAKYIDVAAQLMDRLLTDLLAFSRISQREMHLEPVELEAVVAGALVDLRLEIASSGTSVETIAPWPVVMGHAPTLRQVLVNLIGNATKFVGIRDPHVRIWSEEKPGGIIRIWVEDNGIGIRPEYHERIFQVFQRLHTTAYEGTGIGLAIVQRGTERMGGRVGVVSALGQGSKFWLELTQAPPAAPRLNAGEKPP